VTAAVGADVVPIFYDVDPDTLGPDFESLEQVLRAGARTIVAAHLYGNPVDWGRLSDIANRFDARIVEDAAMGHGGEWRGDRLGSLGTLAILSFGRGKGWTGAGGGALLARGEIAGDLDARSPLPSDDGVATSGSTFVAALGQAVFGSPALYGIPAALPGLHLGETVYRPPGRIAEMSTICARIALATLAEADREVSARRALAARYRSIWRSGDGLNQVAEPVHGLSGALRYPLRVSGGLASLGREAFSRALGIEASYPRVLPTLDVVASIGSFHSAGWPGAQRLVDELLTLPTHSFVEHEDFARITDLLQRVA
jgi:dTDP-4-amino-4,6-dideoxygalactose transaminase